MSKEELICVAFLAIGGWHIAQGLRARGHRSARHTFGTLSGGILRGKSVSWAVMLWSGITVAVASVLALVLTLTMEPPATSADFKFDLPPGWVDLSPGAPAENFERMRATQSPLSNADPQHLALAAGVADHGHYAMVEARVAQGVWSPSLEAVRVSAKNSMGDYEGLGLKPETHGHELVSVQGTTVGRFQVTMPLPNGDTMEGLVYILPGKRSRAFVAYSAHSDLYDKYVADFEGMVASVAGVGDPNPYPKPVYLPLAALVLAGLAWTLLAKDQDQ